MPEKNDQEAMSSSIRRETRHDTAVITEEKVRTRRPNRYAVVLLNDDYTPMEFVVWLLQTVFHKPHGEATRLMLDVHNKGRGVCGVYTLDVAQTKVDRVHAIARQHEHPLQAVIEAEEGDET